MNDEALFAVLTARRRRHSVAVAAKARSAFDLIPVGLRPVVERAALLHDIGYGHPDLGFHPIDGARFLVARGEDPRVCHAVATHSGAHWEAHHRGIDWTVFQPFTCHAPDIGLVRSIVTWADMTTSPDGCPVTTTERLEEILQRYPDHDPVHHSVTAATAWLLLAGTHPTATAHLDPADQARTQFHRPRST